MPYQKLRSEWVEGSCQKIDKSGYTVVVPQNRTLHTWLGSMNSDANLIKFKMGIPKLNVL